MTRTMQDPNDFSPRPPTADLEFAMQQVHAHVAMRRRPTKFITYARDMLTIIDLFNPDPYDRARNMFNMGWRGPWHRGATRST